MVAQPPSIELESDASPLRCDADSGAADQANLISTLFEQYRHRAVAYAHRLVGFSDAEDVVQEAFLKLTRCRSITPAHVNAPFILAATRNAAMTFLKRRSLELKHRTEASERRGVSLRSHGVPRTLVDERFLDELTEGQREVLILVEVMGLTETQAGVALDISRPVVHAKKSAAMHSLRARFTGKESSSS